jgi:hypothetical protein
VRKDTANIQSSFLYAVVAAVTVLHSSCIVIFIVDIFTRFHMSGSLLFKAKLKYILLAHYFKKRLNKIYVFFEFMLHILEH